MLLAAGIDSQLEIRAGEAVAAVPNTAWTPPSLDSHNVYI